MEELQLRELNAALTGKISPEDVTLNKATQNYIRQNLDNLYDAIHNGLYSYNEGETESEQVRRRKDKYRSLLDGLQYKSFELYKKIEEFCNNPTDEYDNIPSAYLILDCILNKDGIE